MTDRIAELRALLARLQTDENPFAQFEALLVAERNLPALLDCAEALTELDAYLDQLVCHASTASEWKPNALVAKARAALARLNGDDHD